MSDRTIMTDWRNTAMYRNHRRKGFVYEARYDDSGEVYASVSAPVEANHGG